MTAADLDGDTLPELIVAEAWGDRLLVLDNLGGGAFGPADVVPDGLPYALTHAWVEAADVDQDGDGDVIVTSLNEYYTSGDTAVLRNVGGELGPRTRLGGEAWSVHAFDLEPDGDVDVHSSGDGGSPFVVYANGAAGFGPGVAFTGCTYHHESAAAADLDGDGDPDFACAKGATLSWYENQGGAFPVERPVDAGGLWMEAVGTADLDGDGDVDLLVADTTGEEVRWYENPYGLAAPPTDTAPPESTGDTGGGPPTDTAPPSTTPVDSGTPPAPRTEPKEERGCGCGTDTGGAWLAVLLIARRSRGSRSRSASRPAAPPDRR